MDARYSATMWFATFIIAAAIFLGILGARQPKKAAPEIITAGQPMVSVGNKVWVACWAIVKASFCLLLAIPLMMILWALAAGIWASFTGQ